MLSALLAIVVLASIFLARPLTVLIHELGHAVPAMLITGKSATIYVGSLGDPTKSKKFQIGPLTAWFTYNPFMWDCGLCISSAENSSLYKRFIYTLTGPLTSLIFGICCLFLMFRENTPMPLQYILLVFTGSFAYDFYTNLKPNPHEIKLYNGKSAYNDGMQLKQIIKMRNYPDEFMDGVRLYSEKKYREAALLFDTILQNHRFPDLFRMAMYSHSATKNYEKALTIFEQLCAVDKLSANDYINAGYANSQLGRTQEGLELYQRALKIEPNHPEGLNNQGYSLNILGRYNEAIPFFDYVLRINPLNAYAYNNRGLSKIKLGLIKEGLEDIEKSLTIDNGNSYAYLHLGIYHFDQAEYEKALEYFKKSEQSDETTYRINDWIEETEKRISQ